MSTYYTASANYLDDAVLPMTPQRYLRSGLPSEYSSPYLSIPMMNYYNNLTGSGGSSGGSNRTPLSPLIKVEEDVLVMDGVLVRSKSKSSSSSNSNSGGSLYKTELCKSWEETGYCRYGFHCQFAHGQEELRSIPSRHRNMKKLEMSKSRSSSQSSTYSPVVFSLDNAATSTPPGPATASSTSKVKKPLPLPSKDWSPMDDGIIVSLPGSTDVPPTRIDVDEHINGVLYGPPTRNRLPMFRDLCPE